MEASIWSKIPDDLLYRILALLPLKSLLSLRPTCKRFNSLLLNPSFLSLLTSSSSSSSSSSSFLLLSHPQFSPRSLPLYDSSTDLWRTIRLPSSPSSSSSQLHLLSLSSGLLLFSIPSGSGSSPFPSLLVFNPLTNTSTTVRSPIPTSSATLISSPCPCPHGYIILIPSPNSNSLHLYSSLSRSWSHHSSPPSLSSSPTPYHDSILFLTNPQPPFSIHSFLPNSSSSTWDLRPAPALPPDLAFARLLSSNNSRLFLVGGVGRDGISRSLRVWALLDHGGQVWEEVGRLPELMCRKFFSVCYHNYSHVYCMWHDGMVCVCCTTWPEVLFFKIGRGTWHWLPRCPLLQEKWSCGFRWFSFTPHLYALV